MRIIIMALRRKLKLATPIVLLASALITGCSDDVGNRVWTVVRQAASETHFSDVHFVDNSVGWVTGWSGMVTHTEDGGKTWVHRQTCTKRNLDGIYFVDASEG